MAAQDRIEVDLVVVGAGAAGLYAAMSGARDGARVALISATPLAETASYWAQGGLAAALAAEDSPERHRRDTEHAGRGAVRSAAAEVLCREAPARVRDLEALGVRFDADRFGRLALGLEGGHSTRRVVHAGGSATGRRVVRQLSALVAAHPGIAVYEGARAALLSMADGVCVGVQLTDGRSLRARGVVIGTGGAAALWSRTTNPPGSFGSGLLLAHAVGAALADLELVQFHPTAVVGIRGREGFLVTEAIRGEGAVLLDRDGERFVDELAPRDEVARAIQARMIEHGTTSVSLDMRGIDPARFPNVVSALREAGLDPREELVPVAPAAHYVMGGIVTDLEGRSTVAGLHAVGEAACTGLHGANRLASNSLSECFVFGRRAALAALAAAAPSAPTAAEPPPATAAREADAATEPDAARAPDAARHTGGDPNVIVAPTPETRAAVWRCAGLQREAHGLERLLEDPYPLARLIAASALARRESRGAHLRLDFPHPDPALDGHHAVIAAPGAAPALERWL